MLYLLLGTEDLLRLSLGLLSPAPAALIQTDPDQEKTTSETLVKQGHTQK